MSKSIAELEEDVRILRDHAHHAPREGHDSGRSVTRTHSRDADALMNALNLLNAAKGLPAIGESPLPNQVPLTLDMIAAGGVVLAGYADGRASRGEAVADIYRTMYRIRPFQTTGT